MPFWLIQWLLPPQAGKSKKTQEIEIYNYTFQTYKENKLILVSFSLLKVRYLFLLQSQNIGTGTFPPQYVLHTLPWSLSVLNIFFSFSFPAPLLPVHQPSIPQIQAWFSVFLYFFFFSRQKEVVVLILSTAVRGDGTLMTLIKLFPILQC